MLVEKLLDKQCNYYNGDVVMLLCIMVGMSQYNEDPISLNFCPGVTPPAYLSYGICSNNAFHIYS